MLRNNCKCISKVETSITNGDHFWFWLSLFTLSHKPLRRNRFDESMLNYIYFLSDCALSSPRNGIIFLMQPPVCCCAAREKLDDQIILSLRILCCFFFVLPSSINWNWPYFDILYLFRETYGIRLAVNISVRTYHNKWPVGVARYWV